jgi:iron(III) transport system substrate-binding protein
MKYTLALISFLALVAFGFEVSAQNASWEALLGKLYEAAENEREVSYNAGNGELSVGDKEGMALFGKRFPGIKLTVSNLASSNVPPRVIAEARAGRISLDAHLDDPPPAKDLIDRGVVLKLNPRELTDNPDKWVFMFDNQLPAISHTTVHLAYNTKLVEKKDLPKSYEDLLNPKWKGKLAVDGRGPHGFTHLRILWGEERFWKFIKAFPEQKPFWDTRCNTSTDRVVVGEVYIGCASFPIVEKLKAKGAPIETLPLDPIFSRVKVYIPLNGRHPNAAKLLIAWLLSPEGVEAVDKAGAGPAIPGTRYHNRLTATGAKLFFNDRLTFEQMIFLEKTRDEIGKIWGVTK